VGASTLVIALAGLTTASALDLSSFAILAGSTITNSGITTISGNIGLSPGTAITGAGPGANAFVLTDGAIYVAPDALAIQAKIDLTNAFIAMSGGPSTVLSGDLGGMLLSAGVYSFPSSAQLTGTLTLSGDADDIFIIQVGSALTTASASRILLDGTVQPKNVFFVVGSSATLGSGSTFVGQILALTDISLNSTARIICGAAWARNGAVTLINNTINSCDFTIAPGEIEDILGDTITDNGGSLTDAIDAYVAGGGDLPLGYELLALLSPEELAEALEQISGEVGTGVAPTGTQAMDSFFSLLRGGGRGPGVVTVTGSDQPQSGGTVSVLGYAPVSEPVADDAFSSFGAAEGMPDPGEWKVWVGGYGGHSVVRGGAAAGSHDRTASDYGLAAGFERQVSADTMFGFAVSGGGTNFDLANSLGSGESAMLQAAIYARSDFDQAYLAGAFGAAYHQVSTDRLLTFAGPDHYTAEFGATNIAGEIEAGYHLGWFTPYVALRAQRFETPDYSEVTESGSSAYALDYEANATLTLRTEIGARADWSTLFGDDGILTLFASAAWAHNFVVDGESTVEFQALSGPSFDISGAGQAADSALGSVGVELALPGGLNVSGELNGSYSDNDDFAYGGTGRLSYHW